MRDDRDPVGAQNVDQRGPDSAEHRVAGGQRDHMPTRELGQQFRQRRAQRRRPRLVDLAIPDGHQLQLARTAQHDFRRTDDGPRGRRQPVPTVGADADDSYPQVRGQHCGDASLRPARHPANRRNRFVGATREAGEIPAQARYGDPSRRPVNGCTNGQSEYRPRVPELATTSGAPL